MLAGAYYYHDEDEKITTENGDEESSAEYNLHAKNTILDSYSMGVGIGVQHRINRLTISFHAGIKAFDNKSFTVKTGEVKIKEKVFQLKEGGGLRVGFEL